MAFIIGLYVLVDIVQHKGLVWILIPKKYPVYKIDNNHPRNKNKLINNNKEWEKAINTKELLNAVKVESSGIECDVYFDIQKNIFDIHHDPDESIGLTLESQFQLYKQRELQASIWIDLKNLDDSNCSSAVTVLSELRTKYDLKDKVLVESVRADLLKVFSDSGFFTSYYTPMFNPYRLSDDEIKHRVDSLSFIINISNVNALSGYYFQYPFLHHYFPNYPILTWTGHDKFSLVNYFIRKKISGAKEIFILL